MAYFDSRGFTDSQDNQKDFNEKYIDTDSRDSEEMSFEQFKKMKTQGKITPRSKGGKSQKSQGRSQQRKPAGA